MKKTAKSAPKGASLVEYGLLVGLVAVVSIGAVSGLGREVGATFTAVQGELSASMKDTAAANPDAGGEEGEAQPVGPTGPGAASFTITSAASTSDRYSRGYNSGVFGRLDSYEGPYPSIKLFQMNTNHNELTLQVFGDYRAELTDHVLTCDDGSSLAINDAPYKLYFADPNFTQISWKSITENRLPVGTQINCEISL